MKKYIYLCGPTVYSKVHIGNMRPIVTFDLILRGMKYINSNIIFIHNITDIDDKIINQAKLNNLTEKEISEKYYLFYLDMLDKYNVKTIDIMPKVTENIYDIEKFIIELLNKDYAYKYDESIYFNTSKLSNYGLVSNINIDELKKLENFNQKHSFDFVLWKNKNEGKIWNTTIGKGRPGWHTECAAFIDKITNSSTLQIHGGGIDLKFPHHENENAQYEAKNGIPITNQWLHIGIINVNNQKMSKSIGNIIKADEFLLKYSSITNSSDLFRLLILTSSINSTIEINDLIIEQLIKKNNQINKIINYVLLNNLNTNDNDLFIKDISNDLINYSFSSICKKLNSFIKKFNELKEKESAIKIFNILDFLGFTCTKKKIDKKYIKIYNEYLLKKEKKEYQESDKLRKILIDNNLI